MRYIIDVSPEKDKEFFDLMKVLLRLEVIKNVKRKGKKDKADLSETKEAEVSSREMANQYRDLVD